MIKKAFLPIVTKNSKILILGTMPGERSLSRQQYYGHKGNHFWKLIYTIFERPLSDDYTERINLLLEKGIALWDVLQYCEREGSADSAIKNEIPNDFAAFFKEYPQIKNVFFASQKAQQLYFKHVKESVPLNFHLLPSPSGANSWKGFGEKLLEWKVIQEYL